MPNPSRFITAQRYALSSSFINTYHLADEERLPASITESDAPLGQRADTMQRYHCYLTLPLAPVDAGAAFGRR